MKALVVGYGSIGRRHADILRELDLDVAVVSRREVDAPNRYSSLAAGLDAWRPGYVVVASRTSEHGADLQTLADRDFDGVVLMEKPLFHHHARPPANLPERTYVGYNLRFHPAVEALRANLSQTRTFALHSYVGQYLPDWRPDTDYRCGYSAQKMLGGGVLRDLSHELDLVNWLLGPWRRLTAAGGKLSGLEIDSDDVYAISLALERCPVATVSMNYLDDRATRRIVALTEAGTVRVDLFGGTFEAGGKSETFDVARDATYIAEHKAVLEGRTEMLCHVDDGIDVMNMILGAEKAASDCIWIDR